MDVITRKLTFKTKGSPHLLNITEEIKDLLVQSRTKEGSLVVFVVGSTAAITTFEFEPGLVKDVEELYERIIPQGRAYHHDQTWGDANGYSHLRASLTGPSLVIPFAEGNLLLGTWQQIVLAEFDNRPRQRQVIVQITGK